MIHPDAVLNSFTQQERTVGKKEDQMMNLIIIDKLEHIIYSFNNSLQKVVNCH